MTTIVKLDELIGGAGAAQDGVRRKFLADDGATMSAELIVLDPKAALTQTVPANCDAYWFVVSGTGTIGDGRHAHDLKSHVFAIAAEGSVVEIVNNGDQALQLVNVISPPEGSGAVIAGYKGPLHVVASENVTLAHEVETKKKRAHFVGPKAIKSERADGMIVHYEAETITRPHFHPDADSIFVILDGALEFTKGHELSVLAEGQAAFINQGHRHGTRVAPGFDKASFLEFHVPAKFQTVQDH
jgi:mannose-6-phosphate isomerase-like protein (cupin superfamily)